MDASAFSSLIEQCADGTTEALRVAADRAITADVFARMQVSGFEYGVTLAELLTEARGGPVRAALHYHSGRARRPSSIAYGDGGTVGLTGTSSSPVGMAIDWLAPVTRRFHVRGWAVASGGAFELDAVHEEQLAAITLAPGNYTVQFSGDVWSATQALNHTVQLRPMLGGTPIATHSLTRANGLTADVNPTIAVHFETSNAIVVASTSVLTLVNPTTYDQHALGLLRVVPS